MIKKFNSSPRAHILTMFVMFAIMLVFNALTQKIADDYMYMYSFVTDEKLTGITDTVLSLIQHGKEGNGRYFAHFFACIFLILPDFVFDIVNSLVFVSVVEMIYYLSKIKDETNNCFAIVIFGFIWLFQLDFGQVCLWLDGSCNYLFGVFFGLLFIIPFIKSLREGKRLPIILIPLHTVISIILGGYLEPLSVGFIGAAGLIFLADLFRYKNLSAFRFIPSLLGSLFGLALMAFAPGEITNKLSAFSLLQTLAVIGVSLLVLLSVSPIIFLFFLFFKRAKKEGADERTLAVCVFIGIGALISNFVMLIAAYYPLRCSVGTVFMSILAVSMLYGALKNRDFGSAQLRWTKVFTVALSLALIVGAVDNAFTYAQIEAHEKIISEADGESVQLYNPVAVTRYNAARFLIYLDTENPEGWPNNFFAEYYGLREVIGKSRFEKFLK